MDQAHRPPARMPPAQLTHQRLHLAGGLPRRRTRPLRLIRQPGQTRLQIPALPCAQRLPGHPNLNGNLTHGCTAQDRQDRPIPLLDDRQLDQSQSRPPPRATPANDAHMEAEPDPTSSMSWHTDVKYVPDQDKGQAILS